MSLPLCDLTEIPRLLCAHCDSFTMTDEERLYLAGWEVYAPTTSTPGEVRTLPEYSGGSWSEPHDVKIADSSTICRTPGCTRPSGDAFVCAPCIDDLEVCLGDVPKLEEDLRVRAMRQARFSGTRRPRKRSEHTKWDKSLADSEDADGIRRAGGQILAAEGFNRTLHDPQATTRLAYLNSTLESAVKQITEQRGLPKPQLDGATAISRWLLSNVRSIALDEGGGDIVADVKREHARAMHAIDCPPDRTYIGLCDECRAPMHAEEGASDYRCHDCGAEYVVAEQVAKINARLQSAILSLREMSELSERLVGRKITIKQLEGMVRWDRLQPVGHRRVNGRHEQIALYRASDLARIMDRRVAS